MSIRFSIFTPTNNPMFLMDCFHSLQAQSFDSWEWVIVLNGGITPEDIPTLIRESKKVKITETQSENIGALKKFAVSKCIGEYVVELDHDDILSPDALELLNRHSRNGVEQADFMYSKWVEFRDDRTLPENDCFNVYGEYYGWKHEQVSLPWLARYGFPENAVVNIPHELSPSSLASIHYAPNHIRVWRSEFYNGIGGHDETMQVCDDYDLVVRTYLNGGKMWFVDEVLYAYRLRSDKSNSYIIHNRKIQEKQAELSEKYFFAICEHWAKDNGYPMLDMGGAHNNHNGWLPVDINLHPSETGFKIDVMKSGLPFPDNSVGCIRAYDFLEHIKSCKDSSCKHGHGIESTECVVGLMNEFYRVLVPGGILLTSTPSTDGRGAWQDPSHSSFWNSNSFWYYTDVNYSKYIRNEEGCRFQTLSISNDFPTNFHKLHNIVYCTANLVALKGQYQPGVTKI